MVTEALVRSCVRPTDTRRGLRHSTPTRGRRAIVPRTGRVGDAIPHVQAEALQALEEWWLPHARYRPTAQETAALRAAPVAPRVVGDDIYQLSLPETFSGSGVRAIPEESRHVQTWGGFLCGDAYTIVAVNVTRSRCDRWRIRYGRAPRCFATRYRRDRSSSRDPRARSGLMV